MPAARSDQPMALVRDSGLPPARPSSESSAVGDDVSLAAFDSALFSVVGAGLPTSLPTTTMRCAALYLGLQAMSVSVFTPGSVGWSRISVWVGVTMRCPLDWASVAPGWG